MLVLVNFLLSNLLHLLSGVPAHALTVGGWHHSLGYEPLEKDPLDPLGRALSKHVRHEVESVLTLSIDPSLQSHTPQQVILHHTPAYLACFK